MAANRVVSTTAPGATTRSNSDFHPNTQKRQEVLSSRTHLVEIDLLRGGNPMAFFGSGIQACYRILVSLCDRRPRADLYVFNLPDVIPLFPLPLPYNDGNVKEQSFVGGDYTKG